MPDPTLRDARADEIALLEALQFRASSLDPSDRRNLEAHPDAIEVQADAVADQRVRVVVINGRVVGFSLVLPITDGRCELDGLFVEPDMMRRGVGRLLIADASARARVAGARGIDVIGNPKAEAFYRAVGFRRGGDVPTRFGVGYRMHLDFTD